MWEKEKLLVTSNFSFSHIFAIFVNFENVVCKLFQSNICRFGKG